MCFAETKRSDIPSSSKDANNEKNCVELPCQKKDEKTPGPPAFVGPPATVKSVTSIKAKVAGTKGVRNPANQLAENVLSASASADESLAANAPVILVRGCNKVELEAVTAPPNTPVTWKVKANENTDAPPTITPIDGGKKAELKTNVHGSFSVIAELDGVTIVWNVVFVWVNVVVKTSVIIKRDNKYADNGSNAAWTQFQSGDFVPGQYAWEAKVKVQVLGGGKTKRLGTDKVKVHILQNGVADTLTAQYSAPVPLMDGTALEVPKGGIPVLDASGAGSPWITVATAGWVKPSANNTYKRELWTGDSPAGSFPRNHKYRPLWSIISITGINGFSAAIASVSDDAPNALMVHAKTEWSADYKGDVDGVGKYTPSGAKTTKEASFKLISAATGGKDAGEAGFETFPPRFNGGTNTDWTPNP